jgi:hypothetical protein
MNESQAATAAGRRRSAFLVMIVLIAALAACSKGGKGASAHSPSIDLSTAKSLDCKDPSPAGAQHPDAVLARLFTVTDQTHTAYTLGWQIVPYGGPARTYQFGKAGNLLALEPAAGGRPLGYGSGTVTIAATPDTGSINASIALKAGGSLAVRGTWRCG